jgi:hypothetical protein
LRTVKERSVGFAAPAIPYGAQYANFSGVVGRSRDHRDAAQDIARELADIAAQIASFKGEANAYLGDPNYSTLRLRLENAHAAVEAAAVEARRRVRFNESR